jgi:osmotically-inducible protein OsmY
MPSVKYTRIEVTQQAYLALEAEAILQGKTLKKLASELIMDSVSKKALNFVQDSALSIEADSKIYKENLEKVANKIGKTQINIDKFILDQVSESLLDEGYQGAMLYVAQHTASLQRDELFRILTIYQQNKIPSFSAAELIVGLNI